MHLALLSAEYPPRAGGVGDYTRQLGLALLQRGHAVSVLTNSVPADGPPPPGEPEREILAIRHWDWHCWPAVIRVLDRVRPDVLHIQYQTGAYAMHPAINLLPWRLRQLPERPRLLVTAHDLREPYLFPKAVPLRHWVTRRLLRDVDRAIVTNDQDAIQIHHYHASAPLIPIGSNIAVIPLRDADRTGWRERAGAQAGDRLIGYFGLIGPSKGLDILLEAMHGLPESYRLLIIGGSATSPQDQAFAEQFQGQIERLGMRGRAFMTGQCRAEDVSAYLQAADLLALPYADGASFRRGSLLAALTHGAPVVTTTPAAPLPASTPQLINGQHVLLVPPGDAAALAAAIAQLASTAPLRERLAQAGRLLATQFTWESIAAA